MDIFGNNTIIDTRYEGNSSECENYESERLQNITLFTITENLQLQCFLFLDQSSVIFS